MRNDLLDKIARDITNLSIGDVVGDVEEAIKAGLSPHEIIESGINKGLTIVGEQYDRGEYFLSDLIMSAEIVSIVLKKLEPELTAKSKERVRSKVVIGTVEGDLHDIGKNLVVSLLSATGFEVYDIGIDVSSEKFVEAVRKHNPDVLGMSALLTSCIPSFREVVKALEVAELRRTLKIIIGGRAASDEIAEDVGADGYAESAWKAVEKVKELVNRKSHSLGV